MEDVHGEPTAAELLRSVGEWISGDLSARLEGKARFDARVAANILAMVVREIEASEGHSRRHREALAALGAQSEAELAELVREGRFDGELARVAAAMRPVVEDRVAVANPGHLSGR